MEFNTFIFPKPKPNYEKGKLNKLIFVPEYEKPKA
jgi:hypothetical protein